jgi:hypothetical protein
MSESESYQWERVSILLCSAVRGGYSPHFKQSERALEAWCRSQGIVFDTREVVEAPIDAARDVLAAAFLTATKPAGGPYSHCLMVDAGVGFKVETIKQLITADEPFTAAAVPLRRHDLEKVAAQGDVGAGSCFAIKLTRETRETGRHKLVAKGGAPFMEVDGIGGALICFRPEVLRRIFEAHPELRHKDGFGYFLPTVMNERGDSHVDLMRYALQALRREDNPTARQRIIEDALSVNHNDFERIGEDIAFCNRWRALDTADQPAKIWLLADAPLMHEGHGYFVGNVASIFS